VLPGESESALCATTRHSYNDWLMLGILICSGFAQRDNDLSAGYDIGTKYMDESNILLHRPFEQYNAIQNNTIQHNTTQSNLIDLRHRNSLLARLRDTDAWLEKTIV